MRTIKKILLGSLLLLTACDDSALSPQSSASSEAEQAEATLSWPPPLPQGATPAENMLATNVLILLDNSGSMDERECSGDRTKFEVAKDAVKGFVTKLPAENNVALAVFRGNSGAVIVVPFGSGEAHRAEFMNTLNGLQPSAGTPLRRALADSYEFMNMQAASQRGYGLYRIPIISDGESTDGNPAETAKDIVGRSPIELHVVGFCIGGKHSLDVPGITKYTTASNPAELAKALANVVQAETPVFDATAFSSN